MNPEDHQKIEALFEELSGLSPEERRDRLGESALDGPLRAELEALLEIHDRPGEDDMVAVDLSPSLHPPTATPPPAPEELPGYEILEVLGEGGMGVVYLAEQRGAVERRVAIKVIKLGMDTRQVIARFEAERQVLALMEHDHISRVFEAGSTPLGRPYFVMEYVRGIPITDYADEARLTVKERLELLCQVCEAVQHAHQKGVIHRDLKPTNILVTAAGVPKIIDFGVAKATTVRLTEKTFFTATGQLVGTPEYMSPEQANPSRLDVDTRTDVYSLGVILYQLLTGGPPMDSAEIRSASFDEIRRKIREDDPATPSTRWSRRAPSDSTILAKNRRTTQAAMVRDLRGDLDWITMKAVDKDRARRYPSASELAADIRRHLADEPVLAGPPGARYRLQKFLRRNRVPVTAGAFALSALLVGLTLAILGLLHAQEQRDAAESSALLAEEEATRARTLVDLLEGMFASANPHEEKGHNYTVRELLDEHSDTLSERLKEQPEVEARLRTTIGRAYEGLGIHDRARPHFERALVLHRRLLGDSHWQVITDVLQLGWLVHLQGDYDRAAALYEEALESSLRTRGPTDLLVARAHQYLGDLAYHRDHTPLAEEHLRAALAIYETPEYRALRGRVECLWILGRVLNQSGSHRGAERVLRQAQEESLENRAADNRAFLDVLFELGACLHAQGRIAEAEEVLRSVLDARREKLGDDHLQVAMVKTSLAEILGDQGRTEEAEKLVRESLAVQRRKHGPAHPDTLSTEICLAGVEYDTGRPRAADQRLSRVLELTEGSEKAAWTRTLVLEQLAPIRQEQGRLDDAEALLRECLELRIRLRHGRHSVLASTYHQLGRVALDRDNYPVAEELILRSLAIRLRVHDAPGAEDPQALPTPGDSDAWTDALLSRLPDGGNDALPLTSMLLGLARTRRGVGDRASAAQLIEYVLAQLRAHLPHRHLSQAMTLKLSADIRADGGQFEDALVRYDEALQIARPHAPPRRRLAEILAARARTLGRLRRAKESEAAYIEALALLRADPTESPPTLGNIVNDYGLFLRSLRRHEEAEVQFREALEITRSLRPDPHPTTAAVLNNLGMTRLALGDREGAEPLLTESLAQRRLLFPDPHPAVATTQMNLGDILAGRGELEQALQNYQEALDIFVAVFPRGHPRRALALSKTGNTLRALERSTEAEPFLVAAVAMRRQTMGPTHLGVAGDLNNLGRVRCTLKHYAEAEVAYREALPIWRQRSGEKSRNAAQAMSNLCHALIPQEKYDEAEKFLEESIAIFEQVEPGGASLQFARAQLGKCRAGQERFDEAESLLLDAAESLETAKSGYVTQTREWLVDLYVAWEKPEQAARWRPQTP